MTSLKIFISIPVILAAIFSCKSIRKRSLNYQNAIYKKGSQPLKTSSLELFTLVDVNTIKLNNIHLTFFPFFEDIIPVAILPDNQFPAPDRVVWRACFEDQDCSEPASNKLYGFFDEKQGMIPLDKLGNWFIQFKACIQAERSFSEKFECSGSFRGSYRINVDKLLSDENNEILDQYFGLRKHYSYFGFKAHQDLLQSILELKKCDPENQSLEKLLYIAALGPGYLTGLFWNTRDLASHGKSIVDNSFYLSENVIRVEPVKITTLPKIHGDVIYMYESVLKAREKANKKSSPEQGQRSEIRQGVDEKVSSQAFPSGGNNIPAPPPQPPGGSNIPAPPPQPPGGSNIPAPPPQQGDGRSPTVPSANKKTTVIEKPWLEPDLEAIGFRELTKDPDIKWNNRVINLRDVQYEKLKDVFPNGKLPGNTSNYLTNNITMKILKPNSSEVREIFTYRVFEDPISGVVIIESNKVGDETVKFRYTLTKKNYDIRHTIFENGRWQQLKEYGWLPYTSKALPKQTIVDGIRFNQFSASKIKKKISKKINVSNIVAIDLGLRQDDAIKFRRRTYDTFLFGKNGDSQRAWALWNALDTGTDIEFSSNTTKGKNARVQFTRDAYQFLDEFSVNYLSKDLNMRDEISDVLSKLEKNRVYETILNQLERLSEVDQLKSSDLEDFKKLFNEIETIFTPRSDAAKGDLAKAKISLQKVAGEFDLNNFDSRATFASEIESLRELFADRQSYFSEYALKDSEIPNLRKKVLAIHKKMYSTYLGELRPKAVVLGWVTQSIPNFQRPGYLSDEQFRQIDEKIKTNSNIDKFRDEIAIRRKVQLLKELELKSLEVSLLSDSIFPGKEELSSSIREAHSRKFLRQTLEELAEKKDLKAILDLLNDKDLFFNEELKENFKRQITEILNSDPVDYKSVTAIWDELNRFTFGLEIEVKLKYFLVTSGSGEQLVSLLERVSNSIKTAAEADKLVALLDVKITELNKKTTSMFELDEKSKEFLAKKEILEEKRKSLAASIDETLDEESKLARQTEIEQEYRNDLQSLEEKYKGQQADSTNKRVELAEEIRRLTESLELDIDKVVAPELDLEKAKIASSSGVVTKQRIEPAKPIVPKDAEIPKAKTDLTEKLDTVDKVNADIDDFDDFKGRSKQLSCSEQVYKGATKFGAFLKSLGSSACTLIKTGTGFALAEDTRNEENACATKVKLNLHKKWQDIFLFDQQNKELKHQFLDMSF